MHPAQVAELTQSEHERVDVRVPWPGPPCWQPQSRNQLTWLTSAGSGTDREHGQQKSACGPGLHARPRCHRHESVARHRVVTDSLSMHSWVDPPPPPAVAAVTALTATAATSAVTTPQIPIDRQHAPGMSWAPGRRSRSSGPRRGEVDDSCTDNLQETRPPARAPRSVRPGPTGWATTRMPMSGRPGSCPQLACIHASHALSAGRADGFVDRDHGRSCSC